MRSQIRYFHPSMRATVVIPCYRPDEHFEKVLSDLNAQTSQDFEVIFADDGNDPPLKPRIDAVLRRPFQVIRFETNQGIVAGLNACVQAVTTPYIIRMDADDRMPSDRIEQQLRWMENHPSVDVSGGDMVTFGQKVRWWSKPTSPEGVHAELLWGPSLNHPTVIAKTSVLQQNPYPSDASLAEDYMLWVELATKGLMLSNCPKVLVYYRLAGQNTSQTGRTKRAERYFELFERVLTTMTPDSLHSSVKRGVQQGAHHVLAGVALPENFSKPTAQDVEAHALALMNAMSVIDEPWSRAASLSIQSRMRHQRAMIPWHKAREVVGAVRCWRKWPLLKSPGF